MADANGGKEIFEKRVEYPLPKATGVRDYIFYFVPVSSNSDDPAALYGKYARAFFEKYYHHVSKEVRTLEELINILHEEVTQGGVQQIREIVIVAHGNSQALLHPVLSDGTEATRQNFGYVADISLARLQKAFTHEKFQAFRDKRKTVIARLQADSWVTIRACNFGNSKQGMYATYSFFGGKANVYAPTMYMVFWDCPLVPGSRLETKLQVHKHMVMQHFLPKDSHSPERKDIIVSALVEPARFAEPFEIASMRTDELLPDEAAQYKSVLNDLNAKTKSSLLTAIFLAQGFPLSDSAKLKVKKNNAAWLIDDTLSHEGTRYKIQYQIDEEIAESGPGNRQRATLWARAGLPQALGTQKKFLIQLFIDRETHGKLAGFLFHLASFTDASTNTDASAKTRFDAVLALLQSNKLSNGTGSGVNIGEEFKDSPVGVEVTAPPRPAGKDQWSIDDKEHYLIKLEHLTNDKGVQVHTISVYNKWDKDALAAHQLYVLSTQGVVPDSPGTELAAYLDRLTIDELTSLIDYLRSPFKPGNSFYIHHAQRALIRKREFSKWWVENNADELNAPLSRNSYGDLGLNEWDDLRASSYASDFNRIWSEVKASAPTTAVIQEDLFAEEDLARKFRFSEQDLSASFPDLEPDSFAISSTELSDFEKTFAVHVASSKRIFDEPTEDPTGNCKDFEAAISIWKELQNLELDEIEKLLDEHKTSSGSSFLDIVRDVAKKYKFVRDLAKFVELPYSNKLPYVPTSLDSAGRELVKRILTRELEAELSWWVAAEIPVLSRVAWIQAGLGVLWAYSVISLPLIFLQKFGEEWQNAEEAWELVGKLTAIRQWLRRVEDITYKAKTVPDIREIDISTPVSMMPFENFRTLPFANEPYYIGRFHLERYEETGRYFLTNIFAPDRMKVGFDRGVLAVKFQLASELEHRAKKGVSQLLEQSNFDSCKIQVLIAAGVLDLGALEAQVMGELAKALRDRFPKL